MVKPGEEALRVVVDLKHINFPPLTFTSGSHPVVLCVYVLVCAVVYMYVLVCGVVDDRGQRIDDPRCPQAHKHANQSRHHGLTLISPRQLNVLTPNKLSDCTY